MKNQGIYVSLDIGTTSIKVVVAEYVRGQLNIIGVGNEKSEGLSRGVIVDIDETVESIRKAVRQAEQKSNIQIKDVIVGIPSNQISIEPCHGMIAVSSENREITDVDVYNVISAAKVRSVAPEREIISVIPEEFIVDGFDGIKDIYNKKLKSIYKASIVVTKSMFAALDKVKDKDGRYMLQTDVASPTGYSFGGKTIYKVDDTVFGNEGDMKFFIGDVTEFVKEFDRAQVSVKWVNNDIYGQLLGLFIRLDIKRVDEEAGFFGTYTDVVA